jgi:coenzyme F420-reducing hydrogenase delta subunit
MNRHPSPGQNLGGEPTLTGDPAGTHKAVTPASPKVTVFRCVNSSHQGTEPPPAIEQRPSQPEPEWPIPVHEVAVPCTGRLQPEHLLKAFEAGADAVCVITCAANGCHYLEGSRRAERRVEHVRGLLNEIGLGGQRLLVFHLAAAGQEEATHGRAPKAPSPGKQPNHESLAEIFDIVVAGLGAIQPNPLRQDKAAV